MQQNAFFILEFLIVLLVAFALEHFFMTRRYEPRERARAEEIASSIVADAERLRENAQKEVESIHKQALLDARESAFEFREEAENEVREQRSEVQKLERKLAQREEALETRASAIETKENDYRQRETELEESYRTVGILIDQQREALERISKLTAEDAKAQYLKKVEDENRHHAAKLMRSIEEEARKDGERKARQILTDVIQRCAVDQTSETTVSVVPLPSDEMKGRIIGREGRNIRAFETLTGVDLIIDDTPEAVVLSGFDPVRREVARVALINLIVDGRIHPGRIEEIVRKAQEEVNQRIQEAGEQAVIETEATGLAPEIVQLLGKMKYRTSYGQNVLKHSIEVSHLCGMLAAEVGADARIARRAGLLHDIGKAVDFEIEGPHAVIGADILRRHRENPAVIHAVEAHHHDIEPNTLEDVLVICADQISASRPGARRETLETYVKRLKKLEEIGDTTEGVEKTFAVQAGREIRIIVKPEQVDDLSSIRLARDIAKRIEDEMEYPGQIKVTVIRETRAVDFAK